MKKSIFIALSVLISTVAFAQNPVTWNVKAGMNVSNFTSDYADPKVGFRVGGGMEYAFTDLLSIQPSLLFSTKGAKVDDINATINAMYLELPVNLAARFAISDDVNFVVGVGPYFAYGIGGKTKVNLLKAAEVKTNTFGDDILKRFDFGLGASIAFEFGQFFVSADSQFGLTKLNGDKYLDITGSTPKNLNFNIGVGYKF